MSKSKTIREWLESIENPHIREKALINLRDDEIKSNCSHGQNKKESLHDAIKGAFRWSDTPERHDYWYDFSQSIK